MMKISGTWFDFYHCNPYEAIHWHTATQRFTAEDWTEKIRELAEAGMDTLVLLSVALHGQTFYPSKVFTQRWDLVCPDPLEAVLSAADQFGMHIYIGLGFFTTPAFHEFSKEESRRYTADFAKELVGLYGHHPSFYGWYFPVEAAISEVFPEQFLPYVNTMANECRKIGPQSVLIAPYGTRSVRGGRAFVRQLKALEVDYIAYQDEVGVDRTLLSELDQIYTNLREAHDQAGKPLWTDIETFKFEGRVLVPAPSERLIAQVEIASKYVDKILCYQYLGMMNKPGSKVHAGHEQSTRLYEDYMDYIKRGECK